MTATSLPLCSIFSNHIPKSSFEVLSGDKVILMGESGCGKSSLAKLMGGLNLDYETNLSFKWLTPFLPTICYLDQYSWSINSNILDEICFYESKTVSQTRLIKAAFCSGISDDPRSFVPNPPFDTLHSTSILSGGELRRLSLARVLYCVSDLIILDEPTASLHPSLKETVLVRIANTFSKATIIIISHDNHSSLNMYRTIKL